MVFKVTKNFKDIVQSVQVSILNQSAKIKYIQNSSSLLMSEKDLQTHKI